MTARKQRIDSATAAVRVMAGALEELSPPEHCPLPDEALPFWKAITRGRTREEWESTPALLVTASNLAWVQWQIVRLRQLIDADGDIPDAKATKRLDDLQRLEMAYLRTLQQHGRGAEGEARDVTRRRSVAAGIVKDNPLDDDLLARPIDTRTFHDLN
jgi:uncharacterized protein YqcC (DUF446 family)